MFGTRQTPNRRRIGRLILIGLTALSLILIGGSLMVSDSAQAAQVESEGFTVTDVNETLDGELSGLQLQATANYEYQVEHAETMNIQLVAGPDEETTDTIGYTVESDPSDEDSGSVNLSGDLFDSEHLSRSEFAPGTGNTTTTEVVVGLEMEIETDYGATVTVTEYDTVSVELTDGVEADGTIAGDGEITVVTG